MQMFLEALLLTVLLPAARPAANNDDPSCRAELKGSRLTTTIEFNTGYRLEAPWKVVSSQHLEAPGNLKSIVADLLLEDLVETDAFTGRQLGTRLAEPIRLRLQAPSEPEIVFQAAQAWCTTVVQARRASTALDHPSVGRPGRIT